MQNELFPSVLSSSWTGASRSAVLGHAPRLLHCFGDEGRARPQQPRSAHSPALRAAWCPRAGAVPQPGHRHCLPTSSHSLHCRTAGSGHPPHSRDKSRRLAGSAGSETIKLFLIWLLFLLQSPSAGLLQPLQQNEGIIQPCDAASVFPLLKGEHNGPAELGCWHWICSAGRLWRQYRNPNPFPTLSLQERGVQAGQEFSSLWKGAGVQWRAVLRG